MPLFEWFETLLKVVASLFYLVCFSSNPVPDFGNQSLRNIQLVKIDKGFFSLKAVQYDLKLLLH